VGGAAAGAAPGEVARYAADVRRVLSRNRPKSDWPAGRLRLAFTVSDGGAVANVAVVEASGNGRLDRLATEWISATRFPAPPDGMTDAERTYAIPLTITPPRR
jgi:TonB family protein